MHAMPSAVPHMEFPLYQNENAGIAKNPDTANSKMAGSVAAAQTIAGTAVKPSPMVASIGNAMMNSSTPAVSCLIAMPMR